MPNYRRAYIPGGTYFFTVKTERNAPIFSQKRFVDILDNITKMAFDRWPTEVSAFVLLPDHLHTIWTLPGNDFNYSTRWAWIKKEFSKRYLDAGGVEQNTSASRIKNRRLGVWQRRFWEHFIQDEDDFEAHFDYIHWNPVKHGYALSPKEWPHSSFHKWVKQGVYDLEWGSHQVPPKTLSQLSNQGE